MELYFQAADTPSSCVEALEMNYQYHYNQLIEKHGSWLKPKGVYVERHRKLPEYLGGKYVEGNAFYMSARAHYVAHILWAKITNDPAAWRAVIGMAAFSNRTNSRIFESAKLNSLPNMIAGGKRGGNARAVSGDLPGMASKAGKASATARKKRNLSAFYKTSEECRAIGLRTQLNKSGIFSLSKEEHLRACSLAGKATSEILWKCSECEYASIAPVMGTHQKKTKHQGKQKLNQV